MRLDKFLQLSRLVRRRRLANSLCHAGRVAVNGRRATPAATVKAGDVITVEMASRQLRARVRAVPDARRTGNQYVDLIEDQPSD